MGDIVIELPLPPDEMAIVLNALGIGLSIEKLLDPASCRSVTALYADDALFRKHADALDIETELRRYEGLVSDVVALNAGASIYVAGLAATLDEGIRTAQSVIASGAARRRVEQFVSFTRAG